MINALRSQGPVHPDRLLSHAYSRVLTQPAIHRRSPPRRRSPFSSAQRWHIPRPSTFRQGSPSARCAEASPSGEGCVSRHPKSPLRGGEDKGRDQGWMNSLPSFEVLERCRARRLKLAARAPFLATPEQQPAPGWIPASQRGPGGRGKPGQPSRRYHRPGPSGKARSALRPCLRLGAAVCEKRSKSVRSATKMADERRFPWLPSTA